MELSLAFVETKGFVGAVEAADAMTKTASVHIIKYTKIGDGYVTVLIEGDLSDCQAAVDAGSAAAERIGEFISSGIIARPLDDLELFRKRTAIKENSSIIVKNTKPKSVKADAKLPSATVAELIKNAQDGIAIEELQKRTKKSKEEIRRLLKKLMDEDKVEKIHKKYFWLT